MTYQTPTNHLDTELSGANAKAGASIVQNPKDRNASGPGPQLMAADTLQGDSVMNPQGEDLGDIKAIMLDVRQGRIAYAVLSFGGLMGIGDKLFAIPWHALTLDTEKKCFILNISKEKLKAAPGFDKNHWPEMADSRWANEVHGYYEVQPYWKQY